MRWILPGVLAAIGGAWAYGATGAATDSTTAAQAMIDPCTVRSERLSRRKAFATKWIDMLPREG
jgi:hypothetical protein